MAKQRTPPVQSAKKSRLRLKLEKITKERAITRRVKAEKRVKALGEAMEGVKASIDALTSTKAKATRRLEDIEDSRAQILYSEEVRVKTRQIKLAKGEKVSKQPETTVALEVGRLDSEAQALRNELRQVNKALPGVQTRFKKANRAFQVARNEFIRDYHGGQA
jgi:hypothetical protein